MFTRTEPWHCCYSYMLHNAVTSCALMSCFGAHEDSQDQRSTSTCNLSKKKNVKNAVITLLLQRSLELLLLLVIQGLVVSLAICSRVQQP